MKEESVGDDAATRCAVGHGWHPGGYRTVLVSGRGRIDDGMGCALGRGGFSPISRQRTTGLCKNRSGIRRHADLTRNYRPADWFGDPPNPPGHSVAPRRSRALRPVAPGWDPDGTGDHERSGPG